MHLNPVIFLTQSEGLSDKTLAMHRIVINIASFSMYLLELLSVAIIVYTTIVAFIKLFKKDPYARVYLLHGQSIGLTFKLGAEILRTVTAASLLDIFEVLLLIVIKACMVILIERELKSTNEQENGPQEPVSGKPSAGRFRFSMFHTENHTTSDIDEIRQMQAEIDSLKLQLASQSAQTAKPENPEANELL